VECLPVGSDQGSLVPPWRWGYLGCCDFLEGTVFMSGSRVKLQSASSNHSQPPLPKEHVSSPAAVYIPNLKLRSCSQSANGFKVPSTGVAINVRQHRPHAASPVVCVQPLPLLVKRPGSACMEPSAARSVASQQLSCIILVSTLIVVLSCEPHSSKLM
jgi:hypothetical protein